jgi:hypothetical protein
LSSHSSIVWLRPHSSLLQHGPFSLGLSAVILRAGAAVEALHTEPVALDAAILLMLVASTLQQRIPQRRLVVPREVVPDARQQQRAGAAGGQRPVSLRYLRYLRLRS